MPDFDPNAINMAMAQWAQRMSSQGGGSGSGCAPILMGLNLDVNVGAGLSPQSAAPIKFDGKLQFSRPSPGGMFGLGKIFSDLCGEGVMPGLKKVAEAGALKSCSIAEITGPNISRDMVAGVVDPMANGKS